MDAALWTIPIVLLTAGFIGVVLASRAVFNGPRPDFDSGAAWLIARQYARIIHRIRVRFRERIPRGRDVGPLIVVANHTAGVDPVLIQTQCPFFIRWIMALDMREPSLEWFWRWWQVIFVDRDRRDALALRTALRHLQQGGVIGIFPEGGIERPPRQIMPFSGGVGLLIAKSGAPVLPIVIDGTPQVDPAWASLWKPSASVLHVHETLRYADSGLGPEEIAQDLRRRFSNWTNWPMNDAPQDPRTDASARLGHHESRPAANAASNPTGNPTGPMAASA